MRLVELIIVSVTLGLIGLICFDCRARNQEKPLERSEVNLRSKAVLVFKNSDGCNDKREVAIAFYNGCEYFIDNYYLPVHVASCTNNVHSHK